MGKRRQKVNTQDALWALGWDAGHTLALSQASRGPEFAAGWVAGYEDGMEEALPGWKATQRPQDEEEDEDAL